MSIPARRRKPPAGELGEWLAAMLRSRRWSQADLAHAMGVEPSMVSKWVRGARAPGVWHCEGLARAFGVPPYEVLRLAGHATAPAIFTPTSHPVRDRVHALVEILDPDALSDLLPLMERLVGRPGEGACP